MKAKAAVTSTPVNPTRFGPLGAPIVQQTPKPLSADAIPDNRTRDYSYQELLDYANRAKHEGYNEARTDNNLRLSEMRLREAESSGDKSFWMGALLTAVVLLGGFTAITVWRRK
ncbi:MAG: hypothetical protein JKY65_23175 [Planctomycetes bacterium]|nr:hypothetical protein [Planctomycetota bacterium]